MTKNKKEMKKEDELDVCVDAPSAEHARTNEPAQEPCDDGRDGLRNQEKDKKKPKTEQKNKK